MARTESKQFRIYVRAILRNSEGQILLLKKSPHQKIAGGKWVLPGGAVEFGETPVQALARELKEEICFLIEETKILETETIVLEETHWLGVYFQVHGDTATVKNLEPEKHCELRWCSPVFAVANLTEEASRAILLAEG